MPSPSWANISRKVGLESKRLAQNAPMIFNNVVSQTSASQPRHLSKVDQARLGTEILAKDFSIQDVEIISSSQRVLLPVMTFSDYSMKESAAQVIPSFKHSRKSRKADPLVKSPKSQNLNLPLTSRNLHQVPDGLKS
jgi:hypothetical protein